MMTASRTSLPSPRRINRVILWPMSGTKVSSLKEENGSSHDTQHNDTQPNGNKHEVLICDTRHM
jgi:hypothetical protein